MPFKVSYFWEQIVAKTGGWSESFYHGADDFSTVQTQAIVLGQRLMAVHGKTTVLRNIRFSEYGAFRRAVIAPQTFTTNPEVPDSYTSDYPTTALLLRIKGFGTSPGTPGYTVNQWLKGIPDFVIADGGFYKPTGEYPTRMSTLFDRIISGGWRLKVQDKAVQKKKVNSISSSGLVTLPSHAYASGNYVRISRAKGDTRVNRIWRIQVVSADTFQLLFWQQLEPAIPIFGDPVATLQSAIFVAPADGGCQIIRATERKVGRPFGLLTGRRKARAS